MLVKAYEAGESAASLARRFEANIWSILDRLRKAGVCIRTRVEQNARRLELNRKQAAVLRAIVDGLLLGDGSIDADGSLRLEQATVRRGWLKDVAVKLVDLGATSKTIRIPPRQRVLAGRKIKSDGGYMLYTPCFVELKAERERWYPKGTKRVPADVSFDPLALAYWFCGDGTYDESGALFFCTNGFLKKEVEVLSAGFVKLGVEARRIPTPGRSREHRVAITQRDAAQKFKELIEVYVPKCCRYKLTHVRPTLVFEELSALHRKLTNEQVARLRAAREKGVTMPVLAAKFKVSVTTLYNALRRDT
jgi:LAGLIDADG DNA endonuclease family